MSTDNLLILTISDRDRILHGEKFKNMGQQLIEIGEMLEAGDKDVDVVSNFLVFSLTSASKHGFLGKFSDILAVSIKDKMGQGEPDMAQAAKISEERNKQ